MYLELWLIIDSFLFIWKVIDVAFRLKMNSLVYIHPDNEFFAQDTDSKVPIALGTNEFITVSHDVTHSLPRNTMEGVIQKTSCRDDFVYDDCVRDVS